MAVAPTSASFYARSAPAGMLAAASARRTAAKYVDAFAVLSGWMAGYRPCLTGTWWSGGDYG